MINNKQQKHFFLMVLILLMFSFPIISIFDKPVLVGGFPLLYVFILVAWVLAIVLLIVAAEAKPFQKIRRGKHE